MESEAAVLKEIPLCYIYIIFIVYTPFFCKSGTKDVLIMLSSKDFMEQQQHDFSDSTPRAGSDRLQKLAKSLLSALQLISSSQISPQKYGSGHFDPF